jgi:hypothetical protein
MKKILPLLLLLISSTSYGQIAIEKKTIVEGVRDPVFVGQNLIIPSDCKLVIKEGIKVTIDSSYKFSDILVTKDGVRVEEALPFPEFIISEPGKYKINVVLFDPEKGIKRTESELTIGGTPTPTPSDEKIDNLSVLIMYESADLPKYPISQRSVMQSTDLQVFMNRTLPRDTSSQPLWRILDKDVTFPATCDTTFCKWMGTLDKSKLPLLVLGNKDKIVFQGPLPEDTEQVKALITKHKK